MKALGLLVAVAVGLTALFACSDDRATNLVEVDQTLIGTYSGTYFYSQYIDGAQSEVVSQSVLVSFDAVQFRMVKKDGPQVVCDIAAPYVAGSTISITCPDLPYACPEYKSACGEFTRTWRLDTLKLSCTEVGGEHYTHLKRLILTRM